MRRSLPFMLSTMAFLLSSMAAFDARSEAGDADAGPPNGPALVPNDGGAPPVVPSLPTPPTAPSSQPTPAAPRAPTTAEIMQVVSSLPGLGTWTVIPFAHFRRGDRNVVVAWPAINSQGQLVDATIVGICLGPGESGQMEECSRRWVVRDRAASRAALIRALGGSDYQVVDRGEGAALDELGPRLSRFGSEFSTAVAAGDRDRARQAASLFTTMLPIESVSLDNRVAQLLWAAANHDGRLVHVNTRRQGDVARLTFRVMRGQRRFRTIHAQARQVAGHPDRWIIVNYQ